MVSYGSYIAYIGTYNIGNYANNLFLELSMNICKLSTLENLPSLPSLFKLSLNDNNLTSITGLAEKCPVLLELYLSGNKKISSLDQLDEISKIKSLLKIEIEGCGVQDTEGENYRDKIFKKFPHLQVVDSYNEQGEEMPDDDDEEEEDEVADRNSIIKSYFLLNSSLRM